MKLFPSGEKIVIKIYFLICYIQNISRPWDILPDFYIRMQHNYSWNKLHGMEGIPKLGLQLYFTFLSLDQFRFGIFPEYLFHDMS